jgi:hypothetical protein
MITNRHGNLARPLFVLVTIVLTATMVAAQDQVGRPGEAGNHEAHPQTQADALVSSLSSTDTPENVDTFDASAKSALYIDRSKLEPVDVAAAVIRPEYRKQNSEKAAAWNWTIRPLSSVGPNGLSSPSPATDVTTSKDAGTNDQSPAAGSGWDFAVTPYFFAAGLSGTVGARGRTVTVDASFGSIWDRFDFGVMGTFEAHKGKLVFLGDLMYIRLSDDKQTPGDLFSGIKTKSRLLMLDPEVGYRALNVEGGSIDLLVGARYWHTKNSVTFQAGSQPEVDASQSRDWVDLVFGARGIMRLSPRLYLVGKFDAGGFSISSDFTGQAFGGVGINVKPRLTIVGGYRYLFVNYKSGGFTFNAALSGPIVGAKFKF